MRKSELLGYKSAPMNISLLATNVLHPSM